MRKTEGLKCTKPDKGRMVIPVPFGPARSNSGSSGLSRDERSLYAKGELTSWKMEPRIRPGRPIDRHFSPWIA